MGGFEGCESFLVTLHLLGPCASSDPCARLGLLEVCCQVKKQQFRVTNMLSHVFSRPPLARVEFWMPDLVVYLSL